MDYMEAMNFAIDADLTNVEIELPDELAAEIGETFGNVVNTISNVAQHFYGENPTPEQWQEATVVMVLWFKKNMMTGMTGSGTSED